MVFEKLIGGSLDKAMIDLKQYLEVWDPKLYGTQHELKQNKRTNQWYVLITRDGSLPHANHAQGYS